MILVVDGANFAHRARSGFQMGEHAVVYNFFRQLKALVEQFKPTRVYFTLEGCPKHRLELLPFVDVPVGSPPRGYKANRTVDTLTAEGVKKQASLDDFHRQFNIIVDVLRKRFPISVLRHPDFEGDDVVANIVLNASSAVEFIIVSSDTDFIQLVQERANIKLYNPITKQYVEAPDHDYVLWKALQGDTSDNVPGLVSEARALELANDPEQLRSLVDAATKDLENPFDLELDRNIKLITLHRWTDDEMKGMMCSSPVRDWDAVKEAFETWQFRSMLKESYWEKFQATFDALWRV